MITSLNRAAQVAGIAMVALMLLCGGTGIWAARQHHGQGDG
ncbi:hypothetical protein [Sphingomonas cavernae]|nr:hypothetical protein [Sphingomonas cavernae]